MLTIQVPDINPSDQKLALSLRIEIACFLYQKQIWSLGQAAKFVQMPYIQFQDLLVSKNIPLNYDLEEWKKDLNAIEKFLEE